MRLLTGTCALVLSTLPIQTMAACPTSGQITSTVTGNTVTFNSLNANKKVIVGGLTVTNGSGGSTASQVADLFTNLSASSGCNASALTAIGGGITCTGTLGFTSGAKTQSGSYYQVTFSGSGTFSAYSPPNVSGPGGNVHDPNVIQATTSTPGLATLVLGNTVCVQGSAVGYTAAPWYNQEYHQGSGTSGTLIDYKQGPSSTVDPSETIGTWSISGSDTSTVLNYSYTGGPNFTYKVFDVGGGSYDFCDTNNASNVIPVIYIKQGQVAC